MPVYDSVSHGDGAYWADVTIEIHPTAQKGRGAIPLDDTPAYIRLRMNGRSLDYVNFP